MTIRYTEKFVKQMKKLDKHQTLLLKKWIKKNIEQEVDPRSHGKALVGELTGLWRYRVGDYRIIAEIIDTEFIITLVEVAHRKEIYSRNVR